MPPTREEGVADRPRVLLLLHELTHTGAPRLALRVFGAIDAELLIVAPDPGPLEAAFREIGTLWNLNHPQPGLLRTVIADRLGMTRDRRIGRRVRSWRPDVVYVNSIHALPLVHRLGVGGLPVLLHVHELTVALENFEYLHPGLISETPDRYVAVSQAVADELMDRYKIAADKVVVIPPFVGTLPSSASPARAADGPADSRAPFVVGGIGNPSWTKGLSLWLLAAREAADRLSEAGIRLVWVGVRDNEEGRRFRAMAHKLRLGHLVEFVPETSDPLRHLAGFDVLAMSSWEESASMAVLEAMAHGIPVVCFGASGGPPEEVGDTGIVIPDFSPHAMAEAIVALARDPQRRRELGAAARTRVTSSFTRDANVAAIAAEIAALAKKVTVSGRS